MQQPVGMPYYAAAQAGYPESPYGASPMGFPGYAGMGQFPGAMQQMPMYGMLPHDFSHHHEDDEGHNEDE